MGKHEEISVALVDNRKWEQWVVTEEWGSGAVRMNRELENGSIIRSWSLGDEKGWCRKRKGDGGDTVGGFRSRRAANHTLFTVYKQEPPPPLESQTAAAQLRPASNPALVTIRPTRSTTVVDSKNQFDR